MSPTQDGLLRCARNDDGNRHCEKRSDEAIQPRPREQGFTLVELMVVLVILALLATIVIINVMPAAEHAKVTTAQASVRTLEQAIDMYYLDNRRYPTSREGLQPLLAGRYLRRLENDPWGHPFRYKSPGDDGRPYEIASWGADGREGGTGDDADITN